MVVPATHPAERVQSPFAVRAKEHIAESTEGFHSQFSAIVEAYRAGDKIAGENLLEQFRLPHSDEWFAEHLGTEESAKLTERYDKLFPAFAADLENAISDALENNETLVTDLKDGSEEPPSKLPPNMKLTGIKAMKETILFYSSFELQRNGKIVISWARAFTFEEGAFRFIGFGGKPFWIWETNSFVPPPGPEWLLQRAVLIHSIPPVYPAAARAKGIEGMVTLKLLIDDQGSVKKAEIQTGDPALAQAAIDAVQQWRFKPPIEGGSPAESVFIAQVKFKLSGLELPAKSDNQN